MEKRFDLRTTMSIHNKHFMYDPGTERRRALRKFENPDYGLVIAVETRIRGLFTHVHTLNARNAKSQGLGKVGRWERHEFTKQPR